MLNIFQELEQKDLHIEFCSRQMAKFAVEKWHYSHKMPAGNSINFAVWENGQFIGAVVFGYGSNYNIANQYKLKHYEIRELCRVALTTHANPVTKILSICIKMLKENYPEIQLLVSYADSEQGHIGKIYQANNWIYVGTTDEEPRIKLNNQIYHRKTIYNKYKTSSIYYLKENVDPNAEFVKSKLKYKYLFPLNKSIAKQIKNIAKPYPKTLENE
ncbi:MAG: hypothetical protein KatS3mg002_1072 [Candidatus Woesearchaeota archaeon]|nr:MAG: hypothetical protein KatS3mg002_1072 [Candidatus Woesearchaeota archaeon]